jgi:flagellar hook protein FlgE
MGRAQPPKRTTMSINSSMFTGAAGLGAHGEAMGIISDNIANVNTIGFKSQRGNFADILGAAVNGTRIGAGTMLANVQTNFSQGSLLGTGVVTDLAIRGDGFFMVEGVNEGLSGTYYTRSGQFQLDESGFMVNQAGLRVQGYPADSTGSLSTAVGDLQLSLNSIPPSPTSTVEITANLDADQDVSGVAFDINDPAGTSDFSTSVTVFDSLGRPQQLEIYFNKSSSAPPTWAYNVVTAGDAITPAAAGDFALLDTGSMTFNTDGSMNSYSVNSVTVNWAGADAATIGLDFGTGTGAGGTGVDGITTYAVDSNVTFLNQDGFGSGNLAGIQIDDNGVISGVFTNGQSRTVGQIALARFASNDGLERRGNGLMAATRESGVASVGVAASGGRGAISSGNLEASNVDLAEQFVQMISLQRGFQANSRSITTADQMLTEVVNLKQ